MNRNKQGETGRSECEVTKTRYLEAEELREIWSQLYLGEFCLKTKTVGIIFCTQARILFDI